MLANFYIPRLSNDTKVAVQKNNLGVKLGTEVWTVQTLDGVKTAA